MNTRTTLRILALLLPLAAAGGLARAEQVLIDSDFSAASEPATAPAAPSRSVAGVLPSGWQDDSANDPAPPAVSARYEKTSADGRPVLRLVREHGLLRLMHPLPADASQDSYFRLIVTGRSLTRTPVDIGLRFVDKPRTFPWSTRPDFNEILTDFPILFHLDAQKHPLGLYITLPRDGAVEIARLKLVRMTRDELIAQLKKDFPKGGTRQNLLRVSRFPDGVQSGGAIGRDISDEHFTCEGAPDVAGPSGAPSLKLTTDDPGRGLRFLLPPAQIPWSFQAHTASVYLRGHGSGTFGVLADGDGIASVPFKVDSDEWTRVVLPFTPRFMAGEHQLFLDAAGTVWADAFQLEPGDKPTSYVKRPEVSLSFPETDASVERIQFEDDPAIINFTVTGGGNNTLNARVYNIYGEQKQLPDIALVGVDSGIARGSLQYEVFSGRSFGVFRIEAWVEDESGRRISPYNEIVITRIRRPQHWDEDAPSSQFGAHLGPVAREMTLAKALGINWVRLHDAGIGAVSWASLEPEKGKWNWQDDDIRRYRQHHLSILATLSQTPAWASGLPHPAVDYWDKYLEPRNLDDFSNYVRTLAGHYKDEIRAWDIWNEPWWKYWSVWDAKKNEGVRSPTAAADFAKLEHAAFTAAKSVEPTCTIVGINTTAGAHGGRWTGELAKAGGLVPCDAYSFHIYTNELSGFPGDFVEKNFHLALDPAIDYLQHATTAPSTQPTTLASAPPASAPATQAAASPASQPTTQASLPVPATLLDKPVWMTEGNGTNLSITRGFYHYSAPGEEPEDGALLADKLARYELSLLSLGVKKIFLYHINVGGEFRAGPGEFQSLVTDDGYPDPSAAAHAALAWHVDSRRFVRRIEIARGVFASLFEGDGHSVAVISSTPDHDPYTFPQDVIALDNHDLFGNDVRGGSRYDGRVAYVDLQGSPTELENALRHVVKRPTTRRALSPVSIPVPGDATSAATTRPSQTAPGR